MRKTAILKFTLPFVVAFGVTAPAYACGEPGGSRPIRLVVSQQAGGSTDTLARMWAERVSKDIQTPVVVENRVGAGGIVAAKYVLGQPADGCTLFLAGVSQMVLNKFVYAPLAYNPESDFTPVSMLATVPFVLVANPQSGLRTTRQLVDAAKAKPGSISFASSGNGNSTHLVVELMQKQLGIRMLHVPYRGEPDGVIGTVSGATQVMAPVLSTALPQIKAGKLTPLVLFAQERIAELPDVPTAAELGLEGFDNIGWSGIAAKAGTPAPLVARLHAATQRFLSEPAVVEKLKSMQVLPMRGPANQLLELTVRDTAKWKQAIGELNLSAR